jgi:predicted O-methyltransferase YrrM
VAPMRRVVAEKAVRPSNHPAGFASEAWWTGRIRGLKIIFLKHVDRFMADMQKDKLRFFRRLKRFNYQYFRRKIYDQKILKGIESRRDTARLSKALGVSPEHIEAQMQKFREIITPYYKDYVTSISSEIMAMSLELAIFMLALCEITKPGKVVDFGSGFSSFCLRYWVRNYSPESKVYSVDDASDWLVKTREFLRRYDLPDDQVLTWDEFMQGDFGKFDLILYDFGTFPVRKASLSKVLGFAGHPSMVILDDVHLAEYGLHVKQTLRQNHLECFSTRRYTGDKFNRYAYLSVA